MDTPASPFDDFWTASSLDRFNVAEFAQKLNSYDSDDKTLFLEFPAAPEALPKVKSRVNDVARKRVSTRSFTNETTSRTELAGVLSSLSAWNGPEHRGYPSAGATYSTETFVVGFNAEGLTGRFGYYDPDRHGLVVLGDGPSWDEASTSLNMSVTGTPGLLMVLVGFPSRAIAKYADRGGRFALLEAGAAMQMLSLAVAESRHLKGVIVGGMLDGEWLRILGLAGTDARVVVGYLVGR